MKTLKREEALKVWRQFWDGMQKEFFKVETLQEYLGEDTGPSFDEWLKGNRKRSIELMLADIRSRKMVKFAEDKPAVRLIRIHVVEEPFTHYLEWEIEHYKNINIPLAGEEVYLVYKSDIPDLHLSDFVMFDEERAADFTYSEDGRLVSMDIYDKGEDIQRFIDIKHELMKHIKEVV